MDTKSSKGLRQCKELYRDGWAVYNGAIIDGDEVFTFHTRLPTVVSGSGIYIRKARLTIFKEDK